MRTPITTLFLDIGGVVLTNGWNHHARRRPAKNFRLGWAEMEERHRLTFEIDEEVKARYRLKIAIVSNESLKLAPALPQARSGTIANVVFRAGIDRRDDLGSPDRFDDYYGTADKRIGVARLDMPEFLPVAGVADPPETHRPQT